MLSRRVREGGGLAATDDSRVEARVEAFIARWQGQEGGQERANLHRAAGGLGATLILAVRHHVAWLLRLDPVPV
jgi:hypothetical protein